MSRFLTRVLCAVLFTFTAAAVAQQPANTPADDSVPRLMRYSGTLNNADGTPRTGVVGVTFSLYKAQQGGQALWTEIQNVKLEGEGRYTVLLGSEHSTGMPAELFAAKEARWLGVQVEQDPEQSRVLLVSVPYALKAGDAETVGGHPLSDFVLTDAAAASTNTTGTATTSTTSGSTVKSTKTTSSSAPVPALAGTGTQNFLARWTDNLGTLGNSIIFDTGSNVGVGTSSPTARLQVGAGAASVATEEALHIDGTVPVIRLLYKGNLRWGWLGEYPAAGQSTFWNYASSKPLMTLNSLGRIGMGTTTPSSRLTVGDGVSAEEALHIDGAVPIIRMLSGGTLRWGWLGEFPSAGQSTFWNYTANKPLITLNSLGRVGIGTTSPSARMTVGDGASAEEALHIDGAVPVIRLLSSGSPRWGWLGEYPAAGQSTFYNYTASKPLITLNSLGRVGIGTTSPTNTLTVGGTIESTSGGFKFPDGTMLTTGAVPTLGTNTFGASQVINGNLTLNGQIVINSSGKQMILGGFTSPVGGDVRGAIGTNATASGFGFNVPDPTTGLPVITVDTSGAFNTAILKAVQGGSIPGCTNFTGCVFLNSPAALRGDATSTTVGYGAFGVVGHSVNAIGVYGQSDLGNGVYGTTGGTIHTFAGVLGWATNKTAGNDPWAVYGGNDSDTGGAGGFISNSLTGSTLGVYGETKSDSGTAGSFYAKQNATGGGSTAVYGRAFGDFGVAGWFDATSTVGSAYAVWGRAHSASGVAGVFDVAPGASNGLALWARRCDYVNPCTSLFRVYSDGSAFISGSLTVNSTFYPSSRRFKTNIHTLSNALAMVERMRGVSYDLRSNGEHQIGVIAEEVGEVVPELVAYEANGKDARGVDYSRLTVLLIEAVKEQQEQIKAMQAEISGLKAKVAARERATQVADAR